MSELKATEGTWTLITERNAEDPNWDYAPNPDDAPAYILKADNGDFDWCLAVVLDDGPDGKANGHLFAASKDLYAACEEFVRKVECGEARSTRSYAQMKAALAKARGEQP